MNVRTLGRQEVGVCLFYKLWGPSFSIDRFGKCAAGMSMGNFYIVVDTAFEYHRHRVAQGSKSRQIEMSEGERGILDTLHSMHGTSLNKKGEI